MVENYRGERGGLQSLEEGVEVISSRLAMVAGNLILYR
jgi:hypothetical protein